jgi:hypothetical protein
MKTDVHGNLTLAQFSEEGFVDCVLKIVDLVETNTLYRFRAIASYKDELVAVNVAVVKDIQAGLDSEMKLNQKHVYSKGVVFSRSGAESDRLISAIAAMYGEEKTDLKMINEESYTAIALHQRPFNMADDPVKIKLFGRDAPYDEALYYESFFNLDLKSRLIFLERKGPGISETTRPRAIKMRPNLAVNTDAHPRRFAPRWSPVTLVR